MVANGTVRAHASRYQQRGRIRIALRPRASDGQINGPPRECYAQRRSGRHSVVVSEKGMKDGDVKT